MYIIDWFFEMILFFVKDIFNLLEVGLCLFKSEIVFEFLVNYYSFGGNICILLCGLVVCN